MAGSFGTIPLISWILGVVSLLEDRFLKSMICGAHLMGESGVHAPVPLSLQAWLYQKIVNCFHYYIVVKFVNESFTFI